MRDLAAPMGIILLGFMLSFAYHLGRNAAGDKGQELKHSVEMDLWGFSIAAGCLASIFVCSVLEIKNELAGLLIVFCANGATFFGACFAEEKIHRFFGINFPGDGHE